VGNPVANAEQPLEVLRTVHSFDPCLACAVHAQDPEGNDLATVRVL
jgi:hydrogenase large subunit